LGAHLALEEAQPGEVLCIGSPASYPYGFWGEVVTRYAIERGVVGMVTNQGVRDVRELEELGFPVFCRGHSIQGTLKQFPGDHQVPVRIGQAIVRPGDYIVCDSDGGVTVPAERIHAAIELAREKIARETVAITKIEAGISTRLALGFG